MYHRGRWTRLGSSSRNGNLKPPTILRESGTAYLLRYPANVHANKAQASPPPGAALAPQNPPPLHRPSARPPHRQVSTPKKRQPTRHNSLPRASRGRPREFGAPPVRGQNENTNLSPVRR